MRKIANPNSKELSRAIAIRKILINRKENNPWEKLSYNDASVLYGALNIYTLDRNLPEDVRKRAETMKASLKEKLKQNGIRSRQNL